MRTQSLFLLITVVAINGCHRSEQEPTPVPDYEAAVHFSCSQDLSPYFCKASLKGQQLCYSTNNAFYENFAYLGASYISKSDAAGYSPTAPVTGEGSLIIMGLGGWGKAGKNSSSPPAPVYFSVVTPKFRTTAQEFIQQNIKKGSQLDLVVDDPKTRLPGERPNKFSIELSAQYPTSWGTNVAFFNTLAGPQDPQTAYLKVTEFVPNSDGSYDVTFVFRCKLYDNDGRFYTEVNDAVMRFNLK